MHLVVDCLDLASAVSQLLLEVFILVCQAFNSAIGTIYLGIFQNHLLLLVVQLALEVSLRSFELFN